MQVFGCAKQWSAIVLAHALMLAAPVPAQPTNQETKSVTPRDEFYTTDIRFDVTKINESLARLRRQPFFPHLHPDGKDYPSENHRSASPLPHFVRSKFAVLQASVFGKPDVLTLISCEGCDPNIEIENLRVFIDPKWIESILKDTRYQDPESVIDFVLAHEIAHYVNESEVMNSRDHLSPNGQPSYLHSRLFDPTFLEALSRLPEGSQRNQLLKEAMHEAISRHAEMDLIAKVILDQIGPKNRCDVIHWLRRWTTIPREIEIAVGATSYARINTFKNSLNYKCP